jgi:hypothetical protein
VYFVTVPEFSRHMDIQQEIILGLLGAFETEGIAIAYPAQRLVLEQQPAGPTLVKERARAD